MAAHLRSNIRRYVGGNHLSPPFSQLSAARPSMGARFCSGTSIISPSDRGLTPRRAKRRWWEYIRPAFIVGLGYSICLGIDVFGVRTSYTKWDLERSREGKEQALADLAMMKRDIESIRKRRSERDLKDGAEPEPEPEAKPTTRWSTFRFW